MSQRPNLPDARNSRLIELVVKSLWGSLAEAHIAMLRGSDHALRRLANACMDPNEDLSVKELTHEICARNEKLIECMGFDVFIDFREIVAECDSNEQLRLMTCGYRYASDVDLAISLEENQIRILRSALEWWVQEDSADE